MSSLRVYALKCPSCGAAVRVAESSDVFACTYCGATVQLERADGTVSLQLLTKAMLSIERNSDHTAAELAIRRLREELAQLEESHAGAVAALPLMLRPGVVSSAEERVRALGTQIEAVKTELARQLQIVAF